MAKDCEVKFQSSLEDLEEIKETLSLDEIAVLFSGGGDSLLVADLLVDIYCAMLASVG